MKQTQMKQSFDNTLNGIDMDILMGTVNTVKEDAEMGKCKFRASNKWAGGTLNTSSITGFYGARQEIAHKQSFVLDADEPPILAGNDLGANPVEYLLTALASCLTTSIVAHAAVRGMHIEEIESELEGDLDLNGFLGLDETVPKGFTEIRVKFKVKSDDDIEYLKALSTYSPVFNTLMNGVNVDVQMQSM